MPGSGSAGDIFLQSMFPLHSGRIVGVAGRVLMSVMGVVIATLSITGVLIWARKRRSRRRVPAHLALSPAQRPSLAASTAASFHHHDDA